MAEVVVLRTVPSGSIDLVHIDQATFLQFNCSCEDALPTCKGMCCGMRPLYQARLTDEEVLESDGIVQAIQINDSSFVAYDEQTSHCVHQDMNTRLCNVQSIGHKPQACVQWHCSPKGKGEGITVRGMGWVLNPMSQVGIEDVVHI